MVDPQSSTTSANPADSDPNGDWDNDYLTNLEEYYIYFTDPQDWDTNDNGWSDYDDLFTSANSGGGTTPDPVDPELGMAPVVIFAVIGLGYAGYQLWDWMSETSEALDNIESRQEQLYEDIENGNYDGIQDYIQDAINDIIDSAVEATDIPGTTPGGPADLPQRP